MGLMLHSNEAASVRSKSSSRWTLSLATLLSLLATSLILLGPFSASFARPRLELPDSPDASDPYTLHPEDHKHREAAIIHQTWHVTAGMRRPDGVLKPVYLVNGQFPGPTIEARSGDTVSIEVHNHLEEGLSVHWHGLSMRGFNDMDGAAGITQIPVAPGETFTYHFDIDSRQHGTFWWHAHDGVQRADGLYGGFVVHEPAASSANVDADSESLLMIGDWYHRSARDALTFYSHPGSFGNEPVPDSILLNGQGVFNCSDAPAARPVDCSERLPEKDLVPIRLDGSRRNKVRIINVGSYAGISVGVNGALLTALSVDGGNSVKQVTAQRVGTLRPGERLELLVEPSAHPATRPTYLEVQLDTMPFKMPAIASVAHFPVVWPTLPTRLTHDLARLEYLDTADLKSSASTPGLPQAADHTIVLYAMTQKLSHLGNVPHGFINNTYWRPEILPSDALITLDRTEWEDYALIPQLPYNPSKPLWVDIVLNNLDEEGHPFHLHGYEFYVLSTYSSTFNWGSYNPFADTEAPGEAYDLTTPLKKDTMEVPRRGYAVLRLRVDNPGIWMFHCHVLWHQASGMAMAFEVAT